MDWSSLYPDVLKQRPTDSGTPQVEFADIGCGYGGLLGTSVTDGAAHPPFAGFIRSSVSHRLSVELSPLFPDKLMLGLEIRVKVSDYVQDRIKSLRASEPGSYQNIACIRSNAMKYLPNFFSKGQVGWGPSPPARSTQIPRMKNVESSLFLIREENKTRSLNSKSTAFLRQRLRRRIPCRYNVGVT